MINDTSKLILHLLSLSVILHCLTKGISEFSNLKLYFVTIAFEGNKKKKRVVVVQFASVFSLRSIISCFLLMTDEFYISITGLCFCTAGRREESLQWVKSTPAAVQKVFGK